MCKSLFIVDSTSKLFTIDPATASTHLIGPIGISNVTDIAFHGPTLYGVSFSNFLRINPCTGAGTNIGAIGQTTNGLAVASNGIIYATGGGQLIKINPVTGAGTVVGNFGGGLTSCGDIAIDTNDNLYAALNSGSNVVLAHININTGAATVIGNTGLSTLYGIVFFCCRLYGITNDGNLVALNVVTGNATVIGKTNVFGTSPNVPGNCWGMAAKMCCGCC
jgi:hypothetical protein